MTEPVLPDFLPVQRLRQKEATNPTSKTDLDSQDRRVLIHSTAQNKTWTPASERYCTESDMRGAKGVRQWPLSGSETSVTTTTRHWKPDEDCFSVIIWRLYLKLHLYFCKCRRVRYVWLVSFHVMLRYRKWTFKCSLKLQFQMKTIHKISQDSSWILLKEVFLQIRRFYKRT